MSSKIHTMILTLVAACGFALTTVPAVTQAQPVKQETAKGCPVEDEHGNVTYVPVGTLIGLFHCGADGEWHFGWLVNARVQAEAPPTHVASTTPVSAVTSRQ